MIWLIIAIPVFWCGGYAFGKRMGIEQAKIDAERFWPFADGEAEALANCMESHPAGKKRKRLKVVEG